MNHEYNTLLARFGPNFAERFKHQKAIVQQSRILQKEPVNWVFFNGDYSDRTLTLRPSVVHTPGQKEKFQGMTA